jgi:surface antigen
MGNACMTRPRATRAAITTVLALAGCLTGCMGAARHAVSAGTGAGAKRSERASVAEQIKTAQEKALGEAHGGKADAPILWADTASGLQGSLTYDASVTMTYSCRRYHQTLQLNGQTLTGLLVACPQGDGRWLVTPTP